MRISRVSLALGIWSLPDVGDEVVVGFDQGDLRNPIVRLPASPH